MKEEIQKALEVLRSGGIILYPTDTVWGIGCDASDPEAVAKVYAIKNREDSKSLVLLASDMDMICRYVKEVPEMAVQLVEVNDKPMTIIYPDAIAGEKGCMKSDRRCLAFNTVAEDGTVGIRIPMMDFCQQLVARFGRPIVSTSANVSGQPTPAFFDEISEEIKAGVDYIVQARQDDREKKQPSSIIKFEKNGTFAIIRE
jgi:L-threonylcarbamoyladenylate synthase